MKKTLNIFWQLFKINIKKSMIYRVNFLITIWSMLLWIGLYVIFFEVLFTHVDNLAGWTRGEALTFLAFYYLVQGIGNIFYRENFDEFSEKMRRGLLDQNLSKPANFQLLTFFQNIRIDHFIDVAVTGILFVYIGYNSEVIFSTSQLSIAFIAALLGNVLFYSLSLIITSANFYVDRFEHGQSLFWTISQVSRYPRQIYNGHFKTLFQFIFPIALTTSIPAEISLDAASPKLIGFFIAITLLFFLLGNLIFHRGLKRYHSAN